MNLFKKYLALLWLGVLSSPLVADTVTYFHNDISGTPMVATNAAGDVLWREVYTPYGDRLNYDLASSENTLWFTGRPYESSTGLSYMGARYYDPVLGRFMGMDPQGLDPNNINSFNRYSYANNNPYKYVDPDGNSPIDVVFLAYDVGKLGVAVYTGVGVGAAAADVALSVVGVASPIPGTGQALKVARVASTAVKAGANAEKIAVKAVAVSRAVAAERAVRAAVQFHHPWPKYLGGKIQQILEPMGKELHALYHKGLDDLAPRWMGAKHYEELPAQARAEVLQKLKKYTQAFDAKYGTHLYEAMVREGFPK